MTTLLILRNKRPLAFGEAVEECTTPYNGEGELETMKAKSRAQDAMLGRMLMVQFGQYQDEFSDPDYYPKTDAEKLAFILGNVTVVEE